MLCDPGISAGPKVGASYFMSLIEVHMDRPLGKKEPLRNLHNFPLVCLAQTLKLFGNFLFNASSLLMPCYRIWAALTTEIVHLNLFQILLD